MWHGSESIHNRNDQQQVYAQCALVCGQGTKMVRCNLICTNHTIEKIQENKTKDANQKAKAFTSCNREQQF
jgi:uncharacterized pyridoxal phosphate-containing UPF0001 family protein